MDNSKVLKPIIGPQESAESKKKESSKKKKALIVSALAFLIATGTIWASIAVVKANMPKLEIKFDDWFVESFDFQSMQNFIDENRLSKGEIDKQLPGYVDKKAKDQNVKNADMITNARLTNKIPEDKNNKLPHGIYVEMTAELDYAFTYQADLPLEDNNDEQTKELSSITEEPKQPRYFINSDKSKLYVLVYERDTDSDEATDKDLQTFNDYHITNTVQAFNKLDEYIGQQSKRYTFEEFSSNENNWSPGLEIFYNTLIGLEKQYIKKDSVRFETENGQHVIKITLDSRRSNFYFDENNSNVKYEQNPNDPTEGILTISGLSYFNETLLNLDSLQQQIQDYIKEFKPDEGVDRRYTLDEFRTQMNDPVLKETILKSLGLIKDTPITLEDTDVDVDPDPPETPEEPIPPVIDTSKIKNMYIDNNTNKNLVIELMCDKQEKYKVPSDFDNTKYEFDQVHDKLIVKGLRYYTEYTVTHTVQAFNNLDAKIIDKDNEYTVSEFTAYATGEDTQQACKELIAKGLRANNTTFNSAFIKSLAVTPNNNSETKATLKITFDDDFKKYKTNNNEQYPINHTESTMEIDLDFFKQVEINNLQENIQWFIKNEAGPRYIVEEFESKINEQTTNELQTQIEQLVTNSVQGSSDVNNFHYDRDTNELTFQVTIQKYEKFPSDGPNIKYVLNKKNANGSTVYDVTVSNLKFWFDFSISNEALKETKQKVADFILNNGICSSPDPDEDNYPDFEKDIFDLFGETKLENGMPLIDFMTYNQDDFKLKDTTSFLINLKPKLQGNEWLREFKPVEGLAPEVGIEMTEQDKVLTFKNFEFSTSKAYFIIDETNKEIQGVNEKGRKQKVLKTPSGYPTISNSRITIDGKAYWGWGELLNLTHFTITDSVKLLYNQKKFQKLNFLYYAKSLEYLKISKNAALKDRLAGWDLLYNAKKLSQIDWNKNQQEGWMQKESFGYMTMKTFVTPKYSKKIEGGLSYNNELTTLITWGQDFSATYGFLSGSTRKLTHIILLADDIVDFELPSNANQYYYAPFYQPYKNSSKIKFYVTNNQLKEKMIQRKKEFFFTEDNDDVVRLKIEVIDNLEQKLIEAGTIPSDW